MRCYLAWLLSLNGCTALGILERTRFPSAPGGKGLRAWGLLLLKGFGKALQSQVVVPHLGESLMLLVQADEVNVVATVNGAAPLLHAYIVVPVIEGAQVWPVDESKFETHLRVAHGVAVLFAVVRDRDRGQTARS